jgi:methionyl-tRNA synthetase
VPYFLSRYDPDPLRYYLTATAPETRDTEFSWEDFLERNNNELVATWGNLANRMLSFAYKRFDGRVPEPGELDDEDRALLAKSRLPDGGRAAAGNACKFRAAPRFPEGKPGRGHGPGSRGQRLHIRSASFGSLRTGSACLDRKAPWFQIKEDRQAAATSVYVTRSVRAVDNLKTILAPTRSVPHTAQQLHQYLGYDGQLRCPCTGHAARGRVPGRDALAPGVDLRSQRGHRQVGAERAAAGAGPARAGAAVQEAGRQRG